MYYVPPAQHVSLFQKEGEWRATAASGISDEAETYDFQGSYALSNRFAVMSGLQLASGGTRSDSTDWGAGYLFDAAFGYYRALNKYTIFEVYGGMRYGQQRHYYAENQYNLSASLRLQTFSPFIQPSLGVSLPNFDVALTSGIQYLSFFNFGTNSRYPYYEYMSQLLSQTSGWMWEPGFTVRGGWKHLQLQGQVVRAVPISGLSVTIDDIKISVAISYFFHRRVQQPHLKTRPANKRSYRRYG